MTHPVTGIDHCYALVDDLDEAAARYAALGFTLSPRGLHSAAKGSANHTIMFPRDYFELLGFVAATDANASRRALLAEVGEGLHAIACRIGTAEDAARDLRALGYAVSDPASFARPVSLPQGGTAEAAFTTLSYAPSETPRGHVFMCGHLTPETVWLPELLVHPNGADGLSAILAISEDPEAEAARFARLWQGGAARVEADGWRVETGPDSAPLLLLTAEAMQAQYPGANLGATAQGVFTALRLHTADLAAARACVQGAGISPIETGAGFAVPPEAAAGLILEFTAR